MKEITEKLKKIIDFLKTWWMVGAAVVFLWDYIMRFVSIPEDVEAIKTEIGAIKQFIHRQDSINTNYSTWLANDYNDIGEIKKRLGQ